MVAKSTDYGNDVMVAQFVFLFIVSRDFPIRFKGNGRQKLLNKCYC